MMLDRFIIDALKQGNQFTRLMILTEQFGVSKDSESQLPLKLSLLQSVTLSAVLLVAVIHLLDSAKDILLPILFGFFLSALLYYPLIFFERFHLPRSIVAFVLVLLVAGLLVAGTYALKENANSLLKTLPQVIEELREKSFPVQQAIEDVQSKTDKVEDALANVLETGPDDGPKTVIVEESDWYSDIALEGGRMLWLTAVTLSLCYFFLVGGDVLVKNIAALGGSRQQQARTYRLLKALRQRLASFIGATLLINLGYGLAIGFVLYLNDVELALFWGLGAGLIRYIPFVGAIITISLTVIVTLASQQDITTLLLVTSLVVGIVFFTGNFVDPLVHSHRFQLNPIMIIISIVFWSWVWGAPGLFIAIPALISAAVIFENIPQMAKLHLLICGTPASG